MWAVGAVERGVEDITREYAYRIAYALVLCIRACTLASMMLIVPHYATVYIILLIVASTSSY